MSKYTEIRKAFKVSVDEKFKTMELEGKATFSRREGVKPRNKKTESLISVRTNWAKTVQGTVAEAESIIELMLKENKKENAKVNNTLLTKAFVKLEENRKEARLAEENTMSA